MESDNQCPSCGGSLILMDTISYNEQFERQEKLTYICLKCNNPWLS